MTRRLPIVFGATCYAALHPRRAAAELPALAGDAAFERLIDALDRAFRDSSALSSNDANTKRQRLARYVSWCVSIAAIVSI